MRANLPIERAADYKALRRIEDLKAAQVPPEDKTRS